MNVRVEELRVSRDEEGNGMSRNLTQGWKVQYGFISNKGGGLAWPPVSREEGTRLQGK